MKKVLLLAGVLMTSASLFAQFTQANEPAAGTSKPMFLMDSSAVNYANTTGATVTWDYNGLTKAVAANARLVSVTTAASDPEAASFAGATKVFVLGDFLKIFFKSTTAQRENIGFAFNDVTLGQIKAVFSTNTELVYTYPMAFGNVISNDPVSGTLFFEFPAGVPQSSALTGFATSRVDGTGTLTMPDGTVRTNVTRYLQSDSLTATVPLLNAVTLVRKQYEYFQIGVSNLPIFIHSKIVAAPQGNPTPIADFSIVLSEVNALPNAGLNDADLFSQVVLFPNPATDKVSLSGLTNEVTTITVLDATGRVMETIYSANGTANFDVSNYSAGLYTIKLELNGSNSMKSLVIR